MEKTRHMLAWSAAEKVQEALLTWIASCPDVSSIGFEDLPDNDSGLCISTRQTAFYDRRYIGGGYRAQYQFNIIYRVLPFTTSEVLNAVNFLNSLGAWCEQNTSSLIITSAKICDVQRTSNASVQSVYEDGVKDYNISMTLTWEVI